MQRSTDVGTLTIGGASFLSTFEDVNWSSEGEFDDHAAASKFRAAGQPVKANAKFSVPMRSIKAGQTRVSHLDLTVATLGGLSVATEMVSLALKIGNPCNPVPNAGEFMRRYQVDPGGTIGADVSMEVADAASVALQLLALIESGDPDDLAATLSFTLNGAACTIPGFLRSGGHSVQGRQKVSIGFEGSDPTGTYPTAPTGTSTLLERAINAPKTPLAFTYVSHATEGLTRTGYALIESAEVTMEDAKIVRESYGFRVSAPWTTVLN